MLGPKDIDGWDFDRRDHISALLRAHAAIDAVARGGAPNAAGIPAALQGSAVAFARQAYLPMDDLEALADALGLGG